ncbi:MAG: hypothetical protein ACTSRS_20100 [Candidatus Helarchaeota archaeon]
MYTREAGAGGPRDPPPYVAGWRYKSDGDFVLIREDENGEIVINPIESVESLRKKGLTVEEFRKIYRNSRDEDRERER